MGFVFVLERVCCWLPPVFVSIVQPSRMHNMCALLRGGVQAVRVPPCVAYQTRHEAPRVLHVLRVRGWPFFGMMRVIFVRSMALLWDNTRCHWCSGTHVFVCRPEDSAYTHAVALTHPHPITYKQKSWGKQAEFQVEECTDPYYARMPWRVFRQFRSVQFRTHCLISMICASPFVDGLVATASMMPWVAQHTELCEERAKNARCQRPPLCRCVCMFLLSFIFYKDRRGYIDYPTPLCGSKNAAYLRGGKV